MGLVKNILITTAIIALILFLRAQAADTETVMLTINVPMETSAEELEAVLTVLEKTDANATFFVPGEYNHTALIPERHEVSCYTNSESRLAPLKGENLSSELRNCTGVGFRAPHMDVGNASYQIIREEFAYDSSVYHRYEWFWQEPKGLEQIPITSVLMLPLDSSLSINFIGDFFFTLARKSQQETVVIALGAQDLQEHLLDFEFLIRHYQEESKITTIGDWLLSSE